MPGRNGGFSRACRAAFGSTSELPGGFSSHRGGALPRRPGTPPHDRPPFRAAPGPGNGLLPEAKLSGGECGCSRSTHQRWGDGGWWFSCVAFRVLAGASCPEASGNLDLGPGKGLFPPGWTEENRLRLAGSRHLGDRGGRSVQYEELRGASIPACPRARIREQTLHRTVGHYS
jgi:hypothetical protein